MTLAIERDPWGWVHPFYRRNHPFHDWDDMFMRPSFSQFHPMSMSTRMTPFMSMGSSISSSPFYISTDNQNGDKSRFEVKLDVQQFAPEELEVKLVSNVLTIEGKHEEKRDEHGFISRHFLRKYQLPADVRPEDVTCDLSSDGVLQISAPRHTESKTGKEKLIPIAYTGKPALIPGEKTKAMREANSDAIAA